MSRARSGVMAGPGASLAIDAQKSYSRRRSACTAAPNSAANALHGRPRTGGSGAFGPLLIDPSNLLVIQRDEPGAFAVQQLGQQRHPGTADAAAVQHGEQAAELLQLLIVGVAQRAVDRYAVQDLLQTGTRAL